jgi:hypothetical protein
MLSVIIVDPLEQIGELHRTPSMIDLPKSRFSAIVHMRGEKVFAVVDDNLYVYSTRNLHTLLETIKLSSVVSASLFDDECLYLATHKLNIEIL